MGLGQRLSYGSRWMPSYAWQRLTRSSPRGLVHLMFALADRLWKKAAISVQGRPDWLFIKLHCHSMNPTQHNALLGEAARQFPRELVEGAREREEILHFVSAREMVNIILAACDGREGNPTQYRDYRLKRTRERSTRDSRAGKSEAAVKG